MLLTATGASERHALMIDHQFRPLFAFFEAHALPVAIYATDKDFVDGVLASETVRKKTEQAIADASAVLAARRSKGV